MISPNISMYYKARIVRQYSLGIMVDSWNRIEGSEKDSLDYNSILKNKPISLNGGKQGHLNNGDGENRHSYLGKMNHDPYISHRVCVCVCVCVYSLSCIRLSVTPWTITHQTALSMGFPKQEYLSGLPSHNIHKT